MANYQAVKMRRRRRRRRPSAGEYFRNLTDPLETLCELYPEQINFFIVQELMQNQPLQFYQAKLELDQLRRSRSRG